MIKQEIHNYKQLLNFSDGIDFYPKNVIVQEDK